MTSQTTIETSVISTVYVNPQQTGGTFHHGWELWDVVYFAHTVLVPGNTGNGPVDMTVERYMHVDGKQGANVFVENKSNVLLQVTIFKSIVRNVT